jgi:membrane-associated protein
MIPEIPSLEEIVVWGGYLGLFAIVFAETGLLVGFFLPGDSLLVTAGVFAARGNLDITLLNLLLIVAAITGDAVGYSIGLRAGRALFNRPQSRWFRKDYLLKTQEFYEKYGGITIILARFMPLARTFAPVVAGVAEMKYRRFALFNIFGGIGWVTSMTLTGYFLGRLFPEVIEHIEVVIVVIVFLSILPLLIKYIQVRRSKSKGVQNQEETTNQGKV